MKELILFYGTVLICSLLILFFVAKIIKTGEWIVSGILKFTWISIRTISPIFFAIIGLAIYDIFLRGPILNFLPSIEPIAPTIVKEENWNLFSFTNSIARKWFI